MAADIRGGKDGAFLACAIPAEHCFCCDEVKNGADGIQVMEMGRIQAPRHSVALMGTGDQAVVGNGS